MVGIGSWVAFLKVIKTVFGVNGILVIHPFDGSVEIEQLLLPLKRGGQIHRLPGRAIPSGERVA